MNTLLHDSSTNNLVDLNTDGPLCYVPDNTGLSVVEFVWHTLLDGTISFDVDKISKLVGLEVSLGSNCTILAESLAEKVPCACTVTVRVRHISCLDFLLRRSPC